MDKKVIISAASWMFVVSIVLGWIPLIGAFIAGYGGGKKAGSLSGALIAVIVSIVLMTLLINYAFSILHFKEDVSASLIIVVFNSVLFFGALFGGLNHYGVKE